MKILIVAAQNPRKQVLADAVRDLHAMGSTVDLCGMFDVNAKVGDVGLDGLHSMLIPAEVYGPEFGRRVRLAPIPMSVWSHASIDPWVQDRAHAADVLLALDYLSIYTVWEFSRVNTGAAAVSGLGPARRVVQRLLAKGDNAQSTSDLYIGTAPPRPGRRSIARRIAKMVLSPRILAFPGVSSMVRAAFSVPGIPEGLRWRLAQRTVRALHQSGKVNGASSFAVATSQHLRTAKHRADLLGTDGNLWLAKGEHPPTILEAYGAELEYADELLAAGKFNQAAGSLLEAAHLAFNRVMHFDSLESPLAADPGAYTAPLHHSKVVRTIAAPKGRRFPVMSPPSDRPLRVLIMTYHNANFLGDMLAHFGDRGDIEETFVDLADSRRFGAMMDSGLGSMRKVLAGDETLVETLEALLRPFFDDADVVFLDWCNMPAFLVSQIDPGSARMMIRLHSYEIFTVWPQLVDFSRVDDLIFVSEHIRDLAVAAVPALRGSQAPRLHVLPNALELGRFERPKSEAARFTVGMIGFAGMAKDPLWALEVLRELRAIDDRYRMLLIGGDFQEGHTDTSRTYGREFQQKLSGFERTGIVERIGYSDDVAAELTRIGTILSSSVREGLQTSVIEGAASGAVPVVRDWPFFAGKKSGARTLYPQDWVVETPHEAARRIVEATASVQVWDDYRERASEFAHQHWDLSTVQGDLDRLLLGQNELK